MTTTTREKKITEVLFTFEGRITRSEFWLKGLLPIFIVISIPNCILLYGTDSDGAHAISYILSFVSLWPTLALYIKRLHDRNRSGWLLLTLLIPFVCIIFAIWLLVETWFLRGTVGSNRFGEDPLGNDGTQVQTAPVV